MADRKLNVSHLPGDNSIDKARLRGFIEQEYDKLNQKLPGELLMDVHFKELHKKGAGAKIEAKAKAVVGGITLNATGQEWNAEKALKIALDSIEKESDKAIGKKKQG